MWPDPPAAHRAVAQLLQLLLRHGADLRATAHHGETVLTFTATARNWKTARLLLDLGADWRLGPTPQGQSFAQTVEQALRERDARGTALPHDEGLQAVADWLAQAG